MIKTVHLIFKTHLDIGFTDMAANVVQGYFRRHIPAAMHLAEEMRLTGGDRFIWTTGSWLIYEYLEQASARERKEMEKAINQGDIAWHAIPFTTHTELMDADLFRFGLSLSKELDKRFGKKTIAAKLTDVPGHTIGIVPILAKAGVKLLHIGVNPASAVPDVPSVFRWRAADESEILMIYQGVYGSTLSLPGCEEALAFAHSDDNLGPQTRLDVDKIYENLQKEFPGAKVMASTLDAFARVLEPLKEKLPVVTQEIGDTWIHGIGSDPLKVSQFKELLRLRKIWREGGKTYEESTDIRAFYRKLIVIAEHTWGMDIKTHLADDQNLGRKNFEKARNLPNFKKVETSWDEKRQIVDSAIRSLWNKSLAKEAYEHLLALKPSPPNTAGWKRVDYKKPVFTNENFEAVLDAQSGAILSVEYYLEGKQWKIPQCCLGELTYHTFNQADYDRVWKQYIRSSPLVEIWGKLDFTKPGLENTGAVHGAWKPEMRDFYTRHNACLAFLTFPQAARNEYGAPELMTVEWNFNEERPQLELMVQWFNKPANRLPEALWLSMQPGLGKDATCRMEKLGQLVDPLQVVSRGNRGLHAIQDGVIYSTKEHAIAIHSLDAPLMAPGKPPLLEFPDTLPVLSEGPHFNLYNNLWGTNFPMWFEDDMKFRFEIDFS
jgi:hypothetical protein